MSAWEGKTNLDPYFTSKNTTTMEHRPHGDEISEGLKGAGKSPEDQAWVLRAGRESTSRKRKGGRCFTTGEEPPWGATGARKPGTSKGASRASASKQPGTRTRPPEWAAGPGGRCGGGRAQGREQALEGETCPPGPRPAPQTSRTHGGVRGQHPASACRRPDALMGWGGGTPVGLCDHSPVSGGADPQCELLLPRAPNRRCVWERLAPWRKVGWSGVAKAPAGWVPWVKSNLEIKHRVRTFPGTRSFTLTAGPGPRPPMAPAPRCPRALPNGLAGAFPTQEGSLQPEHGSSHGARHGVYRHRLS